MMLTFIGFIAFFTSTVALFPQIYHTYKTRSAGDISLIMLVNFLICCLSWIAYGLMTHAACVWVTNAVALVSCIAMLALKIAYDKS